MMDVMDLFWYAIRNVLLLALLMLSGGIFALFVSVAYLFWSDKRGK